MLRTDVIDAVNEGNCWALIGSGASAAAGGPTWIELVDITVDLLDEEAKSVIQHDLRFKKARESENLPRAFSRIATIAGRDTLDRLVRDQLARLTDPGPVISLTADWPFAGYITTNYDYLIERALRDLGQRGWVSIGNTSDELRKLSGGATNVVWHLHGAASMDTERSDLVLTEEDYDSAYAEGSDLKKQLASIISQHRLILLGFGFKDPEFMRVLKELGRLANPSRPILAFVPDLYELGEEAERQELLDRYNVDLVSYRLIEESHHQLLNVLETYGAFLVRRSISFNGPPRETPSYDSETTAVLLYNELALRGVASLTTDVFQNLVKTRILSLLQFKDLCSIADLAADLNGRREVLQVEGVSDDAGSVEEEIKTAVQSLRELGFLEINEGGAQLSLSEKGQDEVAARASRAALLSDQFAQSILDRAESVLDVEEPRVRGVAAAAEGFLRECATRRALGLALSWAGYRPDMRKYQAVALLQSLPEHMNQLTNRVEAQGLVEIVTSILANPTEAERRYLGLTLQAQFALHMLGYHRDALSARTAELATTCFVIDSSTLIPLLAEGSRGHGSAQFLVSRLLDLGSVMVTTVLLAGEVAEHVRWARAKIDEAGPISTATLEALTGRAGQRSNAFLEGFFELVATGKEALDFDAYVNRCFTKRDASPMDAPAVCSAIEEVGIVCKGLSEWTGFRKEDWSQVDQDQALIALRRRERDTYKHARQVKAEAEALLIVRQLREQKYSIKGHHPSSTYFMSNTRAIDEVAGAGIPITMRSQAVLHWAGTLAPMTVEELDVFTSSLLWELAERSLSIVDEHRLAAAFRPLISAAQDKREEFLGQHRALIAEHYGESAVAAFAELEDIHVPIALEGLHQQRSQQLESELNQTRRRATVAEAQAKISAREKDELERLRRDKQARAARARSKKRAAEGKGRRRKKKRRKNSG